MSATGTAHVFDSQRLAVAIDAADKSPPCNGELAAQFFVQHGISTEIRWLFEHWPGGDQAPREHWINDCLPIFASSKTVDLGSHFIDFFWQNFYSIPDFARSHLMDVNQVDHTYPWSSSETWYGGWNAQRVAGWLPVIDRFRNRVDLTNYRWDNWSILDRIRKLPKKCENAIAILLQNDDAWESWIDLGNLAKITVETNGVMMLNFYF